MKQAVTTNKNIIFLGSIVIIITTAFIAYFGYKDNNNKIAEIAFTPLEGAVASTYEAPLELTIVRDGDTLIGQKKADLKLIVYEDYSNYLSTLLAKTLNQLIAEYDGRIAILSRPFVNISAPASQQAALSYLCALDSNKGEEMRDLLLQKAETEISGFSPLAYAQELNLDVDKFASCLTDENKLAKLEELKLEAKNNLVLGAPTILIGDELIVGNRPYADFVDSNGDKIEGLKTVIKRHLEEEEKAS
ncbi:MAG: hypothetical protein PWQ35_535 [Patescibacteria group bacterium]|nr:hypothetical protein [Patescibacteria group bacterium]